MPCDERPPRSRIRSADRHGTRAAGLAWLWAGLGYRSCELIAYRDRLNPAAIAREIADIQTVLLDLAKDKTEQRYLATVPRALPDVRKGVRIKAG